MPGSLPTAAVRALHAAGTAPLPPLLARGAGNAGRSRAQRALPAALAAVWLLALCAPAASATDYAVPLQGAAAGDAVRGRAIVAHRQVGLCLLCHSGPIAEERFQGNLAPPLDGAGSRSSAAQLRQRLADPASLNPSTIMPAYYKTEGLARVGPAQQDKTILSAQQIEDVIAYLQTLRAEPAS